MLVMLVDDDAAIRGLVRTWAQEDGATVVEASTADEALAAIEAGTVPAIAFCDLRLPGKDGIWLAEQLRIRVPETAIVMMTGVQEFKAAVSSLQLGVVDYMAKPFAHERFSEALVRAFAAHQSRLALTALQHELADRRAQIADALTELEVNAASSLEAMLAMLRARDPRTYDHSHRVARLAVDLAMTLQIGVPQLSDIERAALLHNLGRLAMPDVLLGRDVGKLTGPELAQLRSYPLHGFAMLRNVPFLAAANAIAVAAHERYDGSGFPHGLKGDEIPLGARIIGAANAYDELVSGPPALSPSAAVEKLTTRDANAFDPLVLGALKILHPPTPQTEP